MARLKFFLFSFYTLPSTIIHELMHALPVLFLTIIDILLNTIRFFLLIPRKPIVRIVSFNIIPDYKTRTLGSVKCANVSPIQSIIISTGPIFSIITILFLAEFLGYISINLHQINNDYSQIININNTNFFSLKSIIFLIISFYLFISSKLSRKDLKNIFHGIFSMQFFSIILLIVLVNFLFDNYYFEIEYFIDNTLIPIKDFILESFTYAFGDLNIITY